MDLSAGSGWRSGSWLLYEKARNWSNPVPGRLFASILFLRYNRSKQIDIVGCDCAEILPLIEAGKIDTIPPITHRYKQEDIEEAYRMFENKTDRIIKIATVNDCASNEKEQNSA